MKKTIDFRTNFEVIKEEDIDNVLNKGKLLYSSESYSDNHPFISPKMTTSLYQFNKYLLWIEVIDADEGLCKTFMMVRKDQPTPQNGTIKVIMDKHNNIEGYCSSSEMVDKFLSDTEISLMKVIDVACVDNTIYESSIRFLSKVIYTFSEDNKWIGTYPEQSRRFDTMNDQYNNFYYTKNYPYIEVDMDDDEYKIIVHTVTKKSEYELIEETADNIFDSLLSTYPLFQDGNCNLNHIKIFNEQLKREYEEAQKNV